MTMNMSGYVSHISDQVSQGIPFPRLLWKYYVEYLWNYQHNSWVARTASTCRVLAILISLPIVVLALLDISSYLIARTLGVIDDVKASTSDTVTLCQTSSPPAILIGSSTPPSQSETPSDNIIGEQLSRQNNSSNQLSQSLTGSDTLNYIGASLPHAFYASEDNDLKLSGVGVFSPASSRPPSPSSEDGSRHGLEGTLRQRPRQKAADEHSG